MNALAYRPYPPPDSPYAMHQAWHNLLFAHWRVPYDDLRHLVHDQLPLDAFQGHAYIGIVPFQMRDVRPRGLPALPWLSAFPELNVRTYVTLDNRPGVYFFSLDAANPVAVEIARSVFHLPYQKAVMSCEFDPSSGDFTFASTRTDRRAPPAYFRARYCLFTTDARGNILRGEIHHPPWQLQLASAEFETNTMTEQIGIRLPADPPLLHFSRQLQMVAWLPTQVERN